MKNERHNDEIAEAVKNAASGYGVIVLAVACFIVVLAVVTFVVRMVVGGGAGVGV